MIFNQKCEILHLHCEMSVENIYKIQFTDIPRITPIMSGCGMADLMCKDCSYKALTHHKHAVVSLKLHKPVCSHLHNHRRLC